jgi:hypothetical protein
LSIPQVYPKKNKSKPTQTQCGNSTIELSSEKQTKKIFLLEESRMPIIHKSFTMSSIQQKITTSEKKENEDKRRKRRIKDWGKLNKASKNWYINVIRTQ